MSVETVSVLGSGQLPWRSSRHLQENARQSHKIGRYLCSCSCVSL